MGFLDQIVRAVGGNARDAAVEVAARTWLKRQTAAVKDMNKLQIDPAAKTISLELELAGEPTPIAVQVGRYQLIHEQGETFIELHDVRTSREWLDVLAAEFVTGRRFPVPTFVRLLL